MSANPEPQWTFRRVYVWAVTALACGALGWIIARAPESDLRELGLRITWLLLAVITIYLIGPTAEHIVAALRAWRGGSSGDRS